MGRSAFGEEPLTPTRIQVGLLAAAPLPAVVEADPKAPGLIDRFARAEKQEEQMEAMSETAEAMAGYMTVISKAAQEIGPMMERASQPGAPMSAWLPARSQLQLVSLAESTHEAVGVLGEVEVGMRRLVKMSRELRAPGRDISAAFKQVSGVLSSPRRPKVRREVVEARVVVGV